MSTTYVPDVGEEHFLDLITAVNYTLRLYTNDVTAGLTDAQIDALVAGSFTEATFAGYAAAALTGGSWTTTPDEPSTGVYAQQTFTRSSTGTTQNVYGYYLTRTTGGQLEYFHDFGGPVAVTNINDAIAVVPRLTLGDDHDTDVAARGKVAQVINTDNDGPFTTSTTSTDMVLSNVPVVAGRLYEIHVHAQATLSVADGAWNVLVRLNGATIDRIEAVRNTTDAVGTFAAQTSTVDGCVYWEPTVTQATDDLDVFWEESSGGATFQADGTATARRTFTITDVGLA